jgi:hypothetical protein
VAASKATVKPSIANAFERDKLAERIAGAQAVVTKNRGNQCPYGLYKLEEGVNA